MWKIVTALVGVASLALATSVQAEDWPSHPVTMINPFAAGGPNDVLARLFAQRMGEILAQPIVLENIGGAGGMNGADRVAKAAPDGYTFLLGDGWDAGAEPDAVQEARLQINHRFQAGGADGRGTAGAGCAQRPPRQGHEGIGVSVD
jgi:hypothetical protein